MKSVEEKCVAKIIDPSKDNRWDAFVENHPLGWISQLSSWGYILENCFNHIKGYYLAIFDEYGNIKAGLPIFSFRSWLTGQRLVSIPHATLCDPLVNSAEEMTALQDAVIDLSKSLGIMDVEIRTFMSGSYFCDAQFDNFNYYQHHYLSLAPGPEQLIKSFHRTCVRQRISRALGSKLELKVVEKESDLASFYELHILTRKRHGLPPHPYKLFKLLWKTLYPSNRINVLYALIHDKPVAALILFKFRKRVSAEFAASDEHYRDLSPNHLLFWEAIKMACQDGFEIFDFGRTPPHNQELMDFKRRWGTQMMGLQQFFYPKQDRERTPSDTKASYKIVQSMCKKMPDALLPYVGNFCYRHLG